MPPQGFLGRRDAGQQRVARTSELIAAERSGASVCVGGT
jgi:hypothetical protein